MKSTEIRGLSVEEANIRLGELEEEAFNLRFQHASSQLASPIQLRHVRRDIARTRTILREQERELATPSGGEENG